MYVYTYIFILVNSWKVQQQKEEKKKKYATVEGEFIDSKSGSTNCTVLTLSGSQFKQTVKSLLDSWGDSMVLRNC